MATDAFWQIDQPQIDRLHVSLAELERRFQHALPDVDWLRMALEACFWASLQFEEGRSIRGSVVYAAAEDCVQRLQLASPTPFTPERIRDLLPAVRPDCAALAATGTAIWGMALQLPHGAFFITIVGPGRLLLRCGERVLASLDGSVLTRLPDLHDAFQALFPRLADPGLRRVVIHASLLMRKIGHGGAIAFVNELGEGLAPQHRLDTASRYQTWADETLAEATLKNEPDNREMQARAAVEGEHRERAKALLLRDIVQLTATDGLLAVGEDLRVLCFGAKIEVAEPPGLIDIIDFGSDEARRATMSDMGGTRHQSAARFAWSRSNSILLVVSQDGRCSLLSGVDCSKGRVLRVLRGFERAVAPDTMTLRFASFANIGLAVLPPTARLTDR